MNSPTNRSLVDAAAAHLASLLPGKWVFTPYNYLQQPGENRGNLIREDGLSIWFISNDYCNRNKVSFSLDRPRDRQNNWVELWEKCSLLGEPEITCTVSKTTAQLANDITKRLLPEAERVYKLAVEKINAVDTAENTRLANINKISNVLRITPKITHDGKPGGKFKLGGFDASCNGYGEIAVHGDTCKIELDNVPMATAIEIVKMLKILLKKA